MKITSAKLVVLVVALALPAPRPAAARPSEWVVLTSENTGAGDVFTEYGTNTQWYLLSTVIEPLFRVQLLPDGSAWGIVPVLAQSWTQPDNRTLIVRLKQGVKFHNGEELTAEHVKYAIDREAIAKSILRGYGSAVPGPLWLGFMGHTEDVTPYPYDAEKAKALLKDAGYPQGIAFDWYITRGVFQKDFEIAQAVANQLAKVGIKANLIPAERARILADRSAGKYEVYSGIWPMVWEPSIVWQAMIGTQSFPDDKLAPQWGPAPPELVEARRLAREATGAKDLQERANRHAQVNRLMHDEAMWLFVVLLDEIWGIQKDTRWRPYPSSWTGDNYWYDYWTLIGKKPPSKTSYDLMLK